MSSHPDLKEIERLSEALHRHDHLYYVLDAPEIADREYDRLLDQLKVLEQKHPEWVLPDSPTQRVGGKVSDKFPPIAHRLPMLSLDNTYNVEELTAFHQRVVKALSSENVAYVGEPKIDGLGVTLLYEDGRLVKGATRGDGKTGEDVTANLKTIRSIPLRIPIEKNETGVIEVRGEVYMDRKAFDEFNRQRQEAGDAVFANPRNAAAGSIRLLDPGVTASRPLNIWIYSVGYCDWALPDTQWETLERLKRLGFRMNPETQLCSGLDEGLALLDKFEQRRKQLPYDTDGLVFKVNAIHSQKKLGSTNKHPRWAVAFKFEAEQAQTRVLDIVVQVGRTGAITPVAELEPVFLSGSTVKRATLHNEDEIRRLDVRVGDSVIIEKAGEIIPKVIRVLTENSKDRGAAFQMPTQCPECASSIIREEGEAVWRCVNFACPAQVKERLLHYGSRNAMDIDHLGEAVVAQLVDQIGVRTFSDLYHLKLDEIKDLERLAEKSGENLLKAIEASKQSGLARLVFGLGIRHVGQRVAQVLAQHFGSIDDLIKASPEDLEAVEEVGPKIADSLAHFFETAQNREEIQRLQKAGVVMTADTSQKTTALSGKQFVLSGTLDSMTREEAKQKIMEAGGRVTSSVSSKTDYVLVGADPGSKATKAKKLGVPILDEAGLNDLLK